MHSRLSHTLTLLLPAVLITGLGTAAAQSRPAPPQVATSPVEVAIGLTGHSLGTDVNAPPECDEWSLPCTHGRPSEMGGFGIALSFSARLSPRTALTGEVGAYANQWDSPESVRTRRAATNVVRAVLIGPTVRSRFVRPGRAGEPGRFFGSILVGVEGSTVLPPRGAVQIGGGVDALGTPHGIIQGGPPFTLRMELDYRKTPGAGRNLSGWRFLFGLVVGPHFVGE